MLSRRKENKKEYNRKRNRKVLKKKEQEHAPLTGTFECDPTEKIDADDKIQIQPETRQKLHKPAVKIIKF